MSGFAVWVLPRVVESGAPITAWIIDDTGFAKKGKHSVGVARQYCGSLGKQDRCQVALSLSLTERGGEPADGVAALSAEPGLQSPKLRHKAKIPDHIGFKKKPQIAADRGIALNVSSVSDRLIVRQDGGLLSITLRNAVEHAAQHAGEKTAIECTVEEAGGQVATLVFDRGPGLSHEALARVRERFIGYPKPA